jgi:hypothetical protein
VSQLPAEIQGRKNPPLALHLDSRGRLLLHGACVPGDVAPPGGPHCPFGIGVVGRDRNWAMGIKAKPGSARCGSRSSSDGCCLPCGLAGIAQRGCHTHHSQSGPRFHTCLGDSSPPPEGSGSRHLRAKCWPRTCGGGDTSQIRTTLRLKILAPMWLSSDISIGSGKVSSKSSLGELL